MQNAAKILILSIAIAAFAGCHKAQPANQADNQQMSMDENLSGDQLPANADIETLPPDESSEASNGELSTGQDNPDVNDLGNSH